MKEIEDYVQDMSKAAQKAKQEGNEERYDFTHRAINAGLDHIERRNQESDE